MFQLASEEFGARRGAQIPAGFIVRLKTGDFLVLET
jgi:hypothetical protein